MNLVTIYGLYGDEYGIELYKYFDLHSLVSSVFAQVLIMGFGTSYVPALWFFMLLNVVGFVLVDRVDFMQWSVRKGSSEKLEQLAV